MWIKYLFMAFISASFGFVVSAGVFTVLLAVGLIPRFAGKSHTAKYILLYEEMVVLGSIAGNFLSVYHPVFQLGSWMLVIFGFFGGVFVGSLALAIAEMLDMIPIFARRISFRHGIGIVVLGIAIGKFVGSMTYFLFDLAKK